MAASTGPDPIRADRTLLVLAVTAPVLWVVALAILVDATDITLGSISNGGVLYEILLRLSLASQLALLFLLAAAVAAITSGGVRYKGVLAATAAGVAAASIGGAVVVVAEQNPLTMTDTSLLAAHSRFFVALLAGIGLVGAALVWWLLRSGDPDRPPPHSVLFVGVLLGASLVLAGGIAAAVTTALAGDDQGHQFRVVIRMLALADRPAFALLAMGVLFRYRIRTPRWLDGWLLAAVGLVSAVLAASATERALDPGTETRFFLSSAQTWTVVAADLALLVAGFALAWWLIQLRRSDPADGDAARARLVARVLGTAAIVLVIIASLAAVIAGGPGSPAGSGTGPLPSAPAVERAYVLIAPLTHAFLLVLAAMLIHLSSRRGEGTPAIVRYAAVAVCLVAIGVAGVFATHALSGGTDTFVLQNQDDRLYAAQLTAIAAVTVAFAWLTRRDTDRVDES